MRVSLALGAVCAYLIALIALAPAALLDVALVHASAGHARIGEPRGSVWSGFGQLQLRDAKDRVLAAEETTWRLRPLSLLAAQIVCEVRIGRDTAAFEVALSPGSLSVANAEVRLPAAALATIPKLAPLQLTGELAVHVTRFAFERNAMHGSASVRWHRAGSVLTPVAPLGDYELTLEGDARGVRASLRTLEGPLVLEGAGTWAPGDRPRFLVTGQVAAEREPELAPFLRLIAVERGKGKFEVQLQ